MRKQKKIDLDHLFYWIKHLRNYLSFCFGAILVLAFAPFHCFFVIFLALPALFLMLEAQKSGKEAFICSFSFGFGFFLLGIYWIANSLLVEPEKFAWLIPFALTLIPSLMACYFGLLGIFYHYFSERFGANNLSRKILIFSLIWLFCEALRGILFSGFPWNLLGYTLLFDEIFAQSAAVFGVYALSFFACLVALLPLFLLQKSTLKASDKLFCLLILMLLIANFCFGKSQIGQQINSKKAILNQQNQQLETEKPISFRLIQANIQQENRWKQDNRMTNLQKHLEMSQELESRFWQNSVQNSGQKFGQNQEENSVNSNQINHNFDAILWSESSVPYPLSNDQTELLSFLQQVISAPTILITGAVRINHQKKKVWNSVFVLDKSGIIATYDKHHLVPFGEYVPFYRLFSFLLLDSVVDELTGGSGGGFSEGESAKTIKLANFSFSPLICYETIFSSQVMDRKYLADFFISLTNDSWFGNSIGPYQHLDIARMRAIEYHRPMLRIASTGISAAINESGEILAKVPLNQAGIIDIALFKPKSTSFYSKFGNLPLLIICGFLLGFIVLGSDQRTKKSRKTDSEK